MAPVETSKPVPLIQMPGVELLAGQRAVAFYFLDWRPVSAVPFQDGTAPRLKQVPVTAVQDYIRTSTLDIGNPGALLDASVLARVDGVIIIRLMIDLDTLFHSNDLDELAIAASMTAKQVLGHRHDVHGPGSTAVPGVDGVGDKVRPPPRSKREYTFSASAILVVPPIQLDPKVWSRAFAIKAFHDRDLRASICVPSIKHPQISGPPRNALIQLRRRYLKVFETLQERIMINRGVQIDWQRSWWAWVFGLIIWMGPANFFYWLSDLHSHAIKGALALAVGGCVCIAVFSGVHTIRWQIPRIRLLRSSITFYSYANPLNGIFWRVFAAGDNPKATRSSRGDDFADQIRILQSKIDGELHRGSLYQNQTTLSIAIAAILATFLAMQVEQKAMLESNSSGAAAASQPASAHSLQHGPAN